MQKKDLKKSSIRSAAILLAAIITAASGWTAFKIGDLHFYFVFQNMFVIFFACLFGSVQGAAVTGIVLIAGVLGAPIFAHGGCGLEYLKGETGGFLTGYFLASILTGYIVGKPSTEEKTPFNKVLSSCLGGFLLIYVIGIYHFMQVKGIRFNQTFFKLLNAMGLRWYLLFDLLKLAISATAAYFLRPVCAKYFYEDNQIQ